jgi:hypothetical protein
MEFFHSPGGYPSGREGQTEEKAVFSQRAIEHGAAMLARIDSSIHVVYNYDSSDLFYFNYLYC